MIPETLLELIQAVIAEPLLLGTLLALATFVTEDGILILGSQLVATEQASAGVVVPALVIGILVGDIGLYLLGYWARSNRAIRRRSPIKAARKFKRWITGRESVVLFASRFMPGSRLPTYVSFGFLGLSLTRFTLVMAIAALIWVAGAVFFIQEIQAQLMAIDDTVGLIGGIAVAFLVIFVIPSLLKRSGRLTQYSSVELDDAKEPNKPRAS